MQLSIEKDIEILNEIIESGWLISDFEKCTAIDACEDAITALKQYPVLDKIRAEIESINVIRHEYSQRQNDYCDGVEFAKRYALHIIDKYKKESEIL